MIFAHDTEVALQATAALVNTAVEPDTLGTLTELDAFVATHEYTGRRTRDHAELDQARGLRPVLRQLFTAGRDDAVAVVNRLLEEHRALPRLVRHDRWDWHVHAIGPDRPLAERIAVEAAMAMVDVIRADEMSRLGVCADADCDGVVLDLSRNRSRKFCSTACGNRAAVAAYRARRAGG
ncbi:MAG: CGNR zinc finger domain-containing protein [Marmoricola sp.]